MKTVTIEELLSWAFVHELPKGGGVEGLVNSNSAWSSILLGTRVSSSSSGGSFGGNYFIEQGEPSDDALAVGEAVRDLRHLDMVVPAGWYPLEDWATDAQSADLAREAVRRVLDRLAKRPAASQTEHLVSLVVGTAVLGRDPDWQAPMPKVRMVERGGMPAWFVTRDQKDSFGRAMRVELDGRNPKSRRPLPGAYRKFEFSIDPAGDIMGRLDYQLWVAALRSLRAGLSTRLVAHRLLPVDRPFAPWVIAATSAPVDLALRPAKKTLSAR